MGMDVCGKKPVNEKGKYFRANIRGWPFLMAYVEYIASPQMLAGCKYWYSNDGDGLNARDSAALGQLLLDQGLESVRKFYQDCSPDEQAYATESIPRLAEFFLYSGGFRIW